MSGYFCNCPNPSPIHLNDPSTLLEIDELIALLISTYGEDPIRTRSLADTIYQRSVALAYPRGEARILVVEQEDSE